MASEMHSSPATRAVPEADRMATGGIMPQAATLQEHVQALCAQGQRARFATPRSFWLGTEMRSLALHPEFLFEVPDPAAIRHVLWRTWSPVATYVRPSDAAHPQNAWLYVCQDQGYHLGKLRSQERTNIRRAQRQFRFDFIDDETVRKHGAKAFCDTRSRVGLSDGTIAAFSSMHAAFVAHPGRAVLAAWAGEHLAAFATLVLVDDWIDLYPYAESDSLNGRPVNGLVHYVLDYFLVQRKFRVVSLGLSSIQEESGSQGLHAFKKKVGCECRPVHRAFVFHPLMRPLANSATLWVLRALRRLRTGNPALRKACGILACHLGVNPLPQDTSDSSEK